jgi:predicted RNase H-like HicB family nuclease
MVEPMKRRSYTAHCVREDGWWIVTVPEIDGEFTHARRLDQVIDLVSDAIALWLEVEPDSFDVVIEADVQGISAVEEATEARRAAEDAKLRASVTTATAVVELFQGGLLPLRDIGTLVGISHQRVAQILDDAKERSA